MKRPIVAILAFVYLAISSGVVMNIHYCMGKLSSVKLQAWSPNVCGCGKKIESKKGCCKTELKLVKVSDAQKVSYADFHFQQIVAPVAVLPNLLTVPVYNAQASLFPVSHSPPLLSKQDTYLLNCVFRI